MTAGVKRVKFEAEIRRPGVKVVCNRENSEKIVKCVLKVGCFFVWYGTSTRCDIFFLDYICKFVGM
ncbi:unnamed protein product [Brassica rapa subsp. trilocularis]